MRLCVCPEYRPASARFGPGPSLYTVPAIYCISQALIHPETISQSTWRSATFCLRLLRSCPPENQKLRGASLHLTRIFAHPNLDSCFQHRGRWFVPLNCSERRDDIRSPEIALPTTTTSFSSSATSTAPVLAFPTPFPQPASCFSPVLMMAVVTYHSYSWTAYSTTF